MRALIIGGGGFVGGYLKEYLLSQGLDVYLTKLQTQQIDDSSKVFDLNILDFHQVLKILKQINPDYIFHLAAQSSVSVSWAKPALTVDVNIKGCINLLEAVRSLNINPRILLIGSAEEYGKINVNENKEGIISETHTTNPCNIYAATKACQNMMGKIYSSAYNMDLIMVRAFNHFGPKQEPTFVVADFCKQVAEIEKNLREPILRVGNLKAKRDFTDVRDVVKAYFELIKSGVKGETYNVGSGVAVGIDEILNIILSMSNAKIEVFVDQNKLRLIDVLVVKADISKIIEHTKWTPTLDIKTTIKDTLDDFRSNTCN